MPSLMREKRLLQQAVGWLSVVPFATGLFGVLFGPALTNETVSISGDSHFRYLSGLLIGVGICFWSTIPGIETKTDRFRLLTAVVFIGGLGRLLGLVLTGIPSFLMLGGLAIELVVTPVMCLWQTRVANRHAEEFGVAEVE
jgi:hypothetical protein